MELWELDVAELSRVYERREASPREVFDSIVTRIDAVDGTVGAFTTLTLERAADDADRHSAELQNGISRGPLHGIPVAIKELYDVGGAESTYGSHVYKGRTPDRDAEAVRRLRTAGAIVMGLTRSHEFGWGITTQHESRGSTRNPWALDRVPGGSSGGAAAAVATGMVPLALGSDSGGSIRIPASYCGVAGIKPTYGRVSLAGAVPFVPTCDHGGPIARTVADLGTALIALAGYDPRDPVTMSNHAIEWPDLGGIENTIIGIAPALHLTPLAPDHERIFASAVDALGESGALIREVHIAEAERIRPTFTTIQLSESYYVHTAVLGVYPSEATEYGSDVIERIEMASRITLAEYLAALHELKWIRRRFATALQEVDVIITPVYAGGPSYVDDPGFADHLGQRIPFRDVVMNYTVPQNLTGLPSASIRAGFDDDGVPVGIQVTGAWGSEGDALRVSAALQVALEQAPRTWPTMNATVREG